MKLNVAYPANGTQMVFNFEDSSKLVGFYDKRISQEVQADFLGDEWKGYILKITGGSDMDGFAMKQGVMTTKRVRLLLDGTTTGFNKIRSGERRRKSVRGCIVDGSLSVLSCIVVKKGDRDIPGLTDVLVPRRLGPKRAGKLRKMFNLSKEDDVRKYVLRRVVKYKNPEKQAKLEKPRTRAPKIQRLITPRSIQRRRRAKAEVKARRQKRYAQAKRYQRVLSEYQKQRILV